MAKVESVQTIGMTYTITDVYSNFPSCDCQHSFEGNFCKHQFKALLDKEHKPGLIVSRLGTRLGSKYAGLCPPTSTRVTHQSTLPLEIGRPADGNLTLPDLNMLPATPPETPPRTSLLLPSTPVSHILDSSGSPLSSATDLETLQPFLSLSPSLSSSATETLDNLMKVFRELANDNSQVMETAVHSVMKGISDITLLRQTQLETGKDFVEPSDSFIIPSGLTKKRHLGAIDFYHGGRNGKRIYGLPKKQRSEKGDNSPPSTAKVRTCWKTVLY